MLIVLSAAPHILMKEKIDTVLLYGFDQVKLFCDCSVIQLNWRWFLLDFDECIES